MSEAFHVPVLVDEVLRYLQPGPGETIVDATAGGGGHAKAIAERVAPGGRLALFDRDSEALAACAEAFRDSAIGVALIHASFARLEDELGRRGLAPVHGVLFDLGVSSHQLDTAERGFSLQADGPLDLRLDQGSGEPGSALLAHATERELSDIFFRYGEERQARRIARAICAERERGPILTTLSLANLVAKVVGSRRHSGIHPATRVFQALRIAVNHELESLEQGLEAAWRVLAPGGRLVAISFQSLEDRIVKSKFGWWCGKCRCAPGLPACACGATRQAESLTRKPVVPGLDEVGRNPRSRSAKLRAIRRLDG